MGPLEMPPPPRPVPREAEKAEGGTKQRPINSKCGPYLLGSGVRGGKKRTGKVIFRRERMGGEQGASLFMFVRMHLKELLEAPCCVASILIPDAKAIVSTRLRFEQ